MAQSSVCIRTLKHLATWLQVDRGTQLLSSESSFTYVVHQFTILFLVRTKLELRCTTIDEPVLTYFVIFTFPLPVILSSSSSTPSLLSLQEEHLMQCQWLMSLIVQNMPFLCFYLFMTCTTTSNETLSPAQSLVGQVKYYGIQANKCLSL